MFDLQDYRVRAAVRQALKNVACASGARSRDNAGPIWTQPLYRRFDLHIRRHRIGSCKVFLFLIIPVSQYLTVRRANRHSDARFLGLKSA